MSGCCDGCMYVCVCVWIFCKGDDGVQEGVWVVVVVFYLSLDKTTQESGDISFFSSSRIFFGIYTC